MKTREIRIRVPDDDLIEKKIRYIAEKYIEYCRAGELFDYKEEHRVNKEAESHVDGVELVRWKQIENTIYEVSDDGRVRNYVTGRELKQHRYMNGYLRCMLDCNIGSRYCHWKAVHRLVAEAFVEKPDGYDIVNHKDLNKYNNRASNLEWTTSKGNAMWNYAKATKDKGYKLDIDKR